MKKKLPIALPNQKFNNHQFETLLTIIYKSRSLLNLIEAIGNQSPENKEAINSFLQKTISDKNNDTLQDKLTNRYAFKDIISHLVDFNQFIKVEEFVDSWYPHFKNSSATKAVRISFLTQLYKQGFDVISWIEKFDDTKVYKHFIDKEPDRKNQEFIHKSLLNFRYVHNNDKYIFDEFFVLLRELPKTQENAQLVYTVYEKFKNYHSLPYFIAKELSNYPVEILKDIGAYNLVKKEENPIASISWQDTHRTVFSLNESYFEDKFKKLNTPHHTKVAVDKILIKRFFEKYPHYKEKYEYGGFNHSNPQENAECAKSLKELINTTDITPLIDLVKTYRKSLAVTYLKNEHRSECLKMIRGYLENDNLYREQPLEKIATNIVNNDKYSVCLTLNLSYIHDKTGGSLSSKPTLRNMWSETLANFVQTKIEEQLGVCGVVGHESSRVNYEFTEKEMQQNVYKKLEEYKEFLCSPTIQSGLEQYSTKEELNKCLNYLYLTYKIETKYNIQENTNSVKKRKI